MIYNVLIVGAGNIGAFFDTPETDAILTHAHAFTKHPGFNLIGFVDTDENKAQKAARLWNTRCFKTIEAAFSVENIDVACVAVPDGYHYSVLKTLENFRLLAVLLEKPLAKTIDEAQEILEVSKNKSLGVFVNYSRRFVPEFERVHAEIRAGMYGEYLTGTGYYGKGILHNASHIIDLLRYFVGEISAVRPMGSIADYYGDDESIAVMLDFKPGKSFFLQYVDCSKYTIFELDLLFENKRIRVVNSGFEIEEHSVMESDMYTGYRYMVKTGTIHTSLAQALYHAADNIYGYLTDGQKIACGIEDGCRALEICLDIKKSMK